LFLYNPEVSGVRELSKYSRIFPLVTVLPGQAGDESIKVRKFRINDYSYHRFKLFLFSKWKSQVNIDSEKYILLFRRI
jgi:hypothetical protein